MVRKSAGPNLSGGDLRGTRGHALLALLCLAPGLLWGVAASARNVALLIGVGEFASADLKTHGLLGPAADLESVQQALTARWRFAPKDVMVLRDRDATHARILAEIAGLEQRSAPGDLLLIYYSGHGTSANDESSRGYDLPYATGAWAPYDLDISSVAAGQRSLIIGRRDLVPRLKRLDASGRLVVVVSDSCFSGQVVRSFGQRHSRDRYLRMMMRDLGVSRAADPPAVLPGARPPPPPYPYEHVLLLSGASDSESGADISSPGDLQLAPTIDGKYHGAFTDAFLRLLNGQLQPGAFTYSQGREAMSNFLEHEHFAQHPQLLPSVAEDPQNIGSQPFLGMNSAAATNAPAPAARTAIVRLRLENVSAPLRAQIGRLSGIAVVEGDADMILSQSGEKAQLKGPAGDPIISTLAGDAHLIKRIAAQAWLNRVVPAGTDGLGLRAETSPGSRGNTFVQCESFVFEVRLQKPAYLMLLDLDSQGDLTVLYPARVAERRLIASGAPQAIPGSRREDQIVVTSPFGSDQVTVFAFERPPAFFSTLSGAQRFTADSEGAAVLARGLGGVEGALSVQKITINTYPGSGNASCAP